MRRNLFSTFGIVFNINIFILNSYILNMIYFIYLQVPEIFRKSQAFLKRIIFPGSSPAIKTFHDGFHKAVVNPAKTV